MLVVRLRAPLFVSGSCHANHLTKRWSERRPAVRSHFVWLGPFHCGPRTLPVAVVHLFLVRCFERWLNHRFRKAWFVSLTHWWRMRRFAHGSSICTVYRLLYAPQHLGRWRSR